MTDVARGVRSASVVRRRLLATLARGTEPVVVVSAPAGAGKSTVAAQWAAADARAHALVRLEGHEENPAALAHRLLDALESDTCGSWSYCPAT